MPIAESTSEITRYSNIRIKISCGTGCDCPNRLLMTDVVSAKPIASASDEFFEI